MRMNLHPHLGLLPMAFMFGSQGEILQLDQQQRTSEVGSTGGPMGA
jgi:hypothetical protein